jgi:ABC-type iron transport system FetAB ATPase subunit
MMAFMKLVVNNLQILNLLPWSFALPAGECMYLSGPSGSGKTRLLRALADLDPHQGEMLLDGVNYLNLPAHEWRSKVAFLPAESQWWCTDVGGHITDYDKALLHELGFTEEVMGWEIARLSSGEKQRLALLRALAQGPEVLLLDEPTANLDNKCTQVIEQTVEHYRRDRGAAVIWVSHDISQIRRITRHGWLIDGDQLKEQKV